MRKVFDFFGEAIKSCNVFTAPVNLRYKLDPDYNTFTGGVVSIGLMILLVSVFFNAWLALLNKQAISSTTQTIREFDPEQMEVNSDNFMFAIGATGLNLSDSTQKQYFTLKMKKYIITNTPDYNRTAYNFNLQPCTENHWEQLGDDFVKTVQRQKISTFMCVPRNTSIAIGGKFTSEAFIYYKISFEKCTGSNCRNQSEIDAWITANISFQMNFYYSNTLINADQKEPISMFFQDKDYNMFSPTLSVTTNLYVGKYIMQTDESIFPWVDTHIQEGFIINRAQKEFWNYINTPSQPYCKLYIRKSNVRLEIQRKFRKLDDMLSYIGGLFGIIAVAFGFVMNYYSQCSFELEMCQNIFDYHNKKQNKTNPNENSQNDILSPNNNHKDLDSWKINQSKSQQTQQLQIIEPKDFRFLDFIFYIIYIPLKKICSIKWRRMQIYEESLEEMRCKLDISQLLEKLSFYDRSLNVLFDEDQLKLLYLQEKYNFEEIREERTMLGMRKDIVANLFGMMAENIPKPDPIVQHKKNLNQIAVDQSRKRLQTFMGKSIKIFELFAQLGKESAENQDDVNLPIDIKTALKKLDQKIEKGDVISIRIYNGLQYEILSTYEKSKMKKTRHNVTNNNPKSIRMKQEKKSCIEKEKTVVMNFLGGGGNSATSIYNLNLN